MNKYIFIICIALLASNAFAKDRVEFVRTFMDTHIQVVHNKKKDIEDVKYISKAFLLKNDLDPFFIKLNSFHFNRYEILGVEGQYVAVRLLHRLCLPVGTCKSKHVVILKVVPQGNGLAIEPHGYNNKYKSPEYLDYWWQSIKGKYPR